MQTGSFVVHNKPFNPLILSLTSNSSALLCKVALDYIIIIIVMRLLGAAI